MKPDVSIRPLAWADAPAAAALSAAIGWNQHQADWERLITLHPEGVVGAWRGTDHLGSDLLGTATLVSYAGQVAWLGMVIVAAQERGKGLGSLLVDAALGSYELADGAVIGLDATELGAPLYERKGFKTVAMIDRWAGVLTPIESAAGMVARRAGIADLERIAAFDRSACDVDRSRLLEVFLSEDDTVVVVAESGNELSAYGVLRAGLGQNHVGPLVAHEQAALDTVISALAEHSANESVYLDAVRLPERTEQLESFGLSVSRTLLRMTRPERAVMCGEATVAATAFEWG